MFFYVLQGEGAWGQEAGRGVQLHCEPLSPGPPATSPSACKRAHNCPTAKIAEDYPWLEQTGVLEHILPKKQELILVKL